MKVSLACLRVFNLMIDGEARTGRKVSNQLKLATGTIYPLLANMKKAKWLSSKLEAGKASLLGRPLQRFYTITPLGNTKARELIAEFQENK